MFTRHFLPQWSHPSICYWHLPTSKVRGKGPQPSVWRPGPWRQGTTAVIVGTWTLALTLPVLSGFGPHRLTFPSFQSCVWICGAHRDLFVYATGKGFQRHSFVCVDSQLSRPVCWKDCSFPHWIVLALRWKSIGCKCESSFLNSHFCPIDPYVSSHASTTLSWLL